MFWILHYFTHCGGAQHCWGKKVLRHLKLFIRKRGFQDVLDIEKLWSYWPRGGYLFSIASPHIPMCTLSWPSVSKRPSRPICVHWKPCLDSEVHAPNVWGLWVLRFARERGTNKCTNIWNFHKNCNPLGAIFITIYYKPFLWLVCYIIWKEKRFLVNFIHKN